MHAGIQWKCISCDNIYARRTIPHSCHARESDFLPIHTESGLKGAEARKYLEEFVRERMDRHWEKVPDPNDKREVHSPRPRVASKVVRKDKVKQPNLNEKLFKIPKKRVETVSRARSPSPIEELEDPQIVVTEEPLFDPPTKILPTDENFVPSMETLTEKARASSEEKKTSSEETVIVQLPLNLDFDITSDETAQSTDTLESILGNMTNLHAQEDFGLAVAGYKTDRLLSVNSEENYIDEHVVDSATTEKEINEMGTDTRVVREIGSEENIDSIIENEKGKVLENSPESICIEIESGEKDDTQEESEIEKDRLMQERKADKKEKRRLAKAAKQISQEKGSEEAKGLKEIQTEEVTAEEQLEKEQRKQKREERKRKKAIKKLLAEGESKRQKCDVSNNEQNVMNTMSSEGESRENELETGNSGQGCMNGDDLNDDVIPAEIEYENNTPVVTRMDRELEIREENEQILKELQGDRITLDVGGRHFATSRRTLLKADGSILKVLVQDGKRHYFIDRDGAHFRYILNYLREDCNLSVAVLPRENRYLMELCNECTFYKLEGLKQLVESRLAIYKDLGLAF